MRWNSVKKTCQWHVFRNSPAGACAKGLSAEGAGVPSPAPRLLRRSAERRFFVGDDLTLRGILTAREALNRSARPLGQHLALSNLPHSSGSRSLFYYANLGLLEILPTRFKPASRTCRGCAN